MKVSVKRGPDGNSGPIGNGGQLDGGAIGIWADYNVPQHGHTSK